MPDAEAYNPEDVPCHICGQRGLHACVNPLPAKLPADVFECADGSFINPALVTRFYHTRIENKYAAVFCFAGDKKEVLFDRASYAEGEIKAFIRECFGNYSTLYGACKVRRSITQSHQGCGGVGSWRLCGLGVTRLAAWRHTPVQQEPTRS